MSSRRYIKHLVSIKRIRAKHLKGFQKTCTCLFLDFRMILRSPWSQCTSTLHGAMPALAARVNLQGCGSCGLINPVLFLPKTIVLLHQIINHNYIKRIQSQLHIIILTLLIVFCLLNWLTTYPDSITSRYFRRWHRIIKDWQLNRNSLTKTINWFCMFKFYTLNQIIII